MIRKSFFITAILICLLLAACARKDISPIQHNLGPGDLSESIMKALADSNYRQMETNLLSPVELHRMIMERKLADHYRDLSAEEKRNYDLRIHAITEHIDQLFGEFETEFWTLMNLGQNRYGIDWIRVSNLSVVTTDTGKTFLHEPIRTLNLTFIFMEKGYTVKIPGIIQTRYGWRIISNETTIEKANVTRKKTNRTNKTILPGI